MIFSFEAWKLKKYENNIYSVVGNSGGWISFVIFFSYTEPGLYVFTILE